MSKLIVSLDFEMRWGVQDRLQDDPNKYKDNLLSVRKNVPWILDIFKERNIKATWASVGALACKDWDEFYQHKPDLLPNYKDQQKHYVNNYNKSIDPQGSMHFADDLIKMILSTPGQELGMHTFGHIYGTEEHVTYDEFAADLVANINIFFNKFGVTPQSLVYPRNQVIYETKLIQDGLISSFRGNESSDRYSAKSQREKKYWNRALALLDAINPLISYAHSIERASESNIQSSAMLRIHMNSFIRKLHLYKLKTNILNLGSDDYYHIWFHPHNIGKSLKRKDDFVKFFDFLGDLISKGKVCSDNMESFSKFLVTKKKNENN